MPQHWYVAVVRRSLAGIALRELGRQGFRTFSPNCRRRVPKRGGGVRYSVGPYLPGYVLVKFDAERDRWRSINGTRGIVRLLSCGEVPTRIRRGVVEEMIRRCAGSSLLVDERLDEIVLESVAAGTALHIDGGTFKGHVGRFIENVHDRVRMLVEAFGKEHAVDVPAEFVTRAVERTA